MNNCLKYVREVLNHENDYIKKQFMGSDRFSRSESLMVDFDNEKDSVGLIWDSTVYEDDLMCSELCHRNHYFKISFEI